MEINPLFLLEFVLFSGVALAWAGYEFWSVRPSKDDKASTTASSDPRHPEGEHRAHDGAAETIER